jgi:hypothetical protein
MKLTVKQKRNIWIVGLVIAMVFFIIGWVTPGTALLLLSGYWFLEQSLTLRNGRAIDKALSQLDVIYGGMRYLGAESEAITTRRLDNRYRPGPLYLEQLCRSKSGAWYKFRFIVVHGTGVPVDFEVQPCSEAEAALWLEREPEQYRRFFGEPKLA